VLSWRIAFPGNQLCSFRMSFPHLDMSAEEAGMINHCGLDTAQEELRGGKRSAEHQCHREFEVLWCKANKMGKMTVMLPDGCVAARRVSVATWRFAIHGKPGARQNSQAPAAAAVEGPAPTPAGSFRRWFSVLGGENRARGTRAVNPAENTPACHVSHEFLLREVKGLRKVCCKN